MKLEPMIPMKNRYLYILALFAITLILRLILLGYYNNNFGGIEPNVIYGIQRLIMGQPLYQSPELGTFAIMQYMPLWYYLCSLLARLFQLDYLNVQGIYIVCRSTALFFNLLTVFVVALNARRQGYPWKQALILGMPVLILLTSHYYTRGDSMHLFFFATTVYLFIHNFQKRNLPTIILLSITTALCLLTKQSGLLLVGYIGFCLVFGASIFLSEKNKQDMTTSAACPASSAGERAGVRPFLAIVIYLTLLALYTIIACQLINGGQWHLFYQNAWLGLRNGFSAQILLDLFTSQYYLDFIPCYLAGGLITWLAIRKIKDQQFRLIATGVLLSFCFALLTGLKKGSSNNYFTEFLVFILLSLPVLMKSDLAQSYFIKIRGRGLTYSNTVWVAILILITSKAIGLFSIMYIDKSLKNNQVEYNRDLALYNWFTHDMHIDSATKIYFTERYFLDNLFINHSIMPTKDVVSQVYEANTTTYNYTAFKEGINKGLVRYIVTDKKDDNINQRVREIPLIYFDPLKFRRIDEKFGFVIYQFIPGE